MDYNEFKDKIEELGDLDMPTPEQKERLIEGEDSIHLTISIGYKLINGDFLAKENITHADKILSSIELIKEREAKRGQDYILTCYWNHEGIVFMTLHTTHAFLSEEDVI